MMASLGVLGVSSAAHANHLLAKAPKVVSVVPNAGPVAGGSLVSIMGANLSGTSAVMFGSASSPYVIVRSKHLVQAIAPPEAGTISPVDVEVTTSSGTSAPVTGDHFSYDLGPTIQSVRPATGSTTGGEQVTISGSGFSDATAVNFDTAPAGFTIDSANAITAITPAHAVGTIDVTVTTPEGTTPIGAADHYTYVLVIPVVSSVVFDIGNQAGGAVVTITGNRFSSPAKVYFGANQATNVTVKNSTTIVATSPSGTAGTTVDVIVDTDAGASAINQPEDEFMYTATGP